MCKYIYIALIIIPLKLAASEAPIHEGKIHTDSVDSLCVKGEEIYSASFDRTIKRTVGSESKIIGKHNDWVRKIICAGSNVITASNDGSIAIWNNLKKIRSVQAHSWWVTDIALSDNKIVSVSLDETVKVWSYPELKLLYSHKIYGSNKHYSVAINNGKAFIGSTHGRMFVLDVNSFKWVKERGITSRYSIPISSVKSGKYIFFGTSDGHIVKVMTSPPYNTIYKKKISNFALKAIAENEGILYIGDDNGVLRKISMDKLKKVDVLNDFPEAIRTLAIDNSSIYAGYDNGYIRIFNKNQKILGNK